MKIYLFHFLCRYDLIDLSRGHNSGENVGDAWDNIDANGNFTRNACFASGW